MPQNGNSQSASLRQRIARALARFLAPDLFAAQLSRPVGLDAVTVRVDDSPGWLGFTGGPNDRDAGEIQKQYTDALEAWRKNPLAKRIVDLVTDYVLGDGMTPSAPGTMGTFINAWWNHPKNHMPLRMPELTDELTRAGDLFLTLHRNPADGLSYVRPIPKDRILRIQTLPNDWETEIAFYEAQEVGEPKQWLSLDHPEAETTDAIMVHYAVNRVVGALMGESDMATIIPWLLRYSRLLEDRVRLHWAARAFLWMVTVPTNLVQSKREQYRAAPDSGSIIVKDESEEWKAVSPDLRGFDAQFDTRSIRQMVDAGVGMPPHWRGEAHDVSLATAEAMEHAASRHLRRRQLYVRHLVTDLCHIAYTRAWQIGRVRGRPNAASIQVEMTDIDRDDNQDLAIASKTIAEALATTAGTIAPAPGTSETLQRRILRVVMRFAGEQIDDDTVDAVFQELAENPSRGEDPRGDPAQDPVLQEDDA